MAKKANRAISYLKKKAWSACSIYIRKKYADPYGWNTCYTCGTRKQWKEMDAGHGFAGRSKAVLFMEDVIRPQCKQCNIFNSGKLDIFTYKLRKEHGEKKFDRLYQEAHSTKGQWKAWELDEMKMYYELHGGYISV